MAVGAVQPPVLHLGPELQLFVSGTQHEEPVEHFLSITIRKNLSNYQAVHKFWFTAAGENFRLADLSFKKLATAEEHDQVVCARAPVVQPAATVTTSAASGAESYSRGLTISLNMEKS